jgi:protein-disulfide isomerase
MLIECDETKDKPVEQQQIDTPKEKNEPAYPPDVFVIPKVTFNYVVIAFVFFVLGTLVGFLTAPASGGGLTEAAAGTLVAQAVSQAISAAGGRAPAVPTIPEFVDVSVDDDPFLGAENAQVTLIEFGDFRCGYCRRFSDETLQQLLTTYEGRLRYVYRDMPILGQESENAAVAAECADDQGAFWQFHDYAYANQSLLSRETYLNFAREHELDLNRFTACLDNPATRQEVVADRQVAQQIGVTGTPGFFVNGRFISGAQPYDVFASVIDEELAAGG